MKKIIIFLSAVVLIFTGCKKEELKETNLDNVIKYMQQVEKIINENTLSKEDYEIKLKELDKNTVSELDNLLDSILANIKEIQQFKKYNKDELYFHDVASFYVSKGNGILEVQDYLGITKNNSLCVGDSNNDISMTYVCEYSYAMGNSTKDLKDSVTGVIETNDKNGLYLFLKDYLDNYLTYN